MHTAIDPVNVSAMRSGFLHPSINTFLSTLAHTPRDTPHSLWRQKVCQVRYAFPDRSALPLHEKCRDVLEEWFQDYPADSKEKFCGVFQARKSRQHQAAFFELY